MRVAVRKNVEGAVPKDVSVQDSNLLVHLSTRIHGRAEIAQRRDKSVATWLFWWQGDNTHVDIADTCFAEQINPASCASAGCEGRNNNDRLLSTFEVTSKRRVEGFLVEGSSDAVWERKGRWQMIVQAIHPFWLGEREKLVNI